jgi:2-methylcitrate dehydratase PrpD
MSSPDYLTRLAALAAGTRFDGLAAATVDAARAVTLDTLGAILAGSRLAENARLAALAAERSGRRTATLVGHGQRAEPMLAALANGTAGVSLEMDEGNRWGGGHPAIHVLPATLAAAEELAVDGRRFIEALIAGYEVTSRLGGASQVRPNVHSHGTWGTAGAAVAVARLRGHDASAIRIVINLATSMSPANSWQPCFEGATVRNLYPGRSNLQGILATHLLACGYSAVQDAPSDLYGTILGERFDRDAVVDGLTAGDRVAVYRIERNYFKFHACCLYNHPVLDAVQALVHGEGFSAHDVQRIRVTSLPFVTRMADPSPANMLAAKFSVPYAVAAAVVKGTTDVAAFGDLVREDARVRRLAARVEVSGDDSMSLRGGPDRPTARVSVELRDGRVMTREAAIVHGDAANPRPHHELEAKFRTLASDVLKADGVNEVIAMVNRLEHLPDIRGLTALLSAAPCAADIPPASRIRPTP